jgi:hypothetical protein
MEEEQQLQNEENEEQPEKDDNKEDTEDKEKITITKKPRKTRKEAVEAAPARRTRKNKKNMATSDPTDKIQQKINEDFEKNKCGNPNNLYKPECNKILLAKEAIEEEILKEEPPSTNTFLYPHLNDPNFNNKIATKKEFSDTQYDGTIYEDIEEHAKVLNEAEFVLSPHQIFVKNFLSFQTPYNSLLLYHGLGSGKTCSAIGVCEESRDYLKQVGISKKILIVAFPNVLDNFKLQLFDDRKLKEVNGIWTINSCIGNKLLNEINPTNVKGLDKAKVILQVKRLINTYYSFLGYVEFSHHIEKIINEGRNDANLIRQKIKKEFDSRLIVIDEVHNIRKIELTKNSSEKDDEEEEEEEEIDEENLKVIEKENERILGEERKPNHKLTSNLVTLVKNADNVRLLLLSGTPMYNSCKEIVWLLNLMNINDRRGIIKASNVFDNDDNLKDDGEKLLLQKSRGYISFVRGENPYTFPYRVYPSIFNLGNYLDIRGRYPNFQMNEKPIEEENKLTHLDLYVSELAPTQLDGYNFIIDNLKRNKYYVAGKEMPSFLDLNTFNYTLLDIPLQALNIIYPSGPLDGSVDSRSLTGIDGLKRSMNVGENNLNYSYKTADRIFSPTEIGKYSSKIKNICENISFTNEAGQVIVSDGIILIYSKYIYGGLVPMALALEEMGFVKYDESGSKRLFETPPTAAVDVTTMLPPVSRDKKTSFAKYAMITGNKNLSPNNNATIKKLTDKANKNGDNIKVVLISNAGSEGLDLKFIRQIHIMDPWYNMNRIEQIIGRGVRNGSHKDLDFELRNVQIFLHATTTNNDIETADLYIYRVAEAKSIKIGKVSRILKENSVDCVINNGQLNFTQENLNQKITQRFSNGKEVNDFQVGDVDNSSQCDYMMCKYENPIVNNTRESDLVLNTYNEKFALNNSDNIIRIIQLLMKERHFYEKTKLFNAINRMKQYPIEQIYASLTQLINNKEIIYDKYSHPGTLINIGDYYYFQPDELTNNKISVMERIIPLDFKPKSIRIENTNDLNLKFKSELNLPANEERELAQGSKILDDLNINYDMVFKYAREAKRVERGDKSWYKYCGITIRLLSQKNIVPPEFISDLVVEHLIDFLSFEDKVELLNYFYSTDVETNEKSLNYKVFQYLTSAIITIGNVNCINLYDKSLQKVYKMIVDVEGKKRWVEADALTISRFTKVLSGKNLEKPYNKIIGFIDYDKIDNMLVFKLMDTENKRNTGARCDQVGNKLKSIVKLNEILKDEIEMDENIRFTKINSKEQVQQELCIFQEFILRFFNKVKTDKIYFLKYEEYNQTYNK